MGTMTRPELSMKNMYWIEKHRYYELKHFCLQYPMWRRMIAALGVSSNRSNDAGIFSKTNTISDPTADYVEARSFYFERMELIEQVAVMAEKNLSSYILKAVTEGLSYDYLKARLDIPCCKDTYYELYRRFFWLLSKKRQ